MTADRPLCILIGALGGQGGGVLADWLVEASYNAGYPAQATSTPGVAQRTGATTYYFELFPEKNPPMDPVFTLFPATGDLDIMAALEPTEAGRALERDSLQKPPRSSPDWIGYIQQQKKCPPATARLTANR